MHRHGAAILLASALLAGCTALPPMLTRDGTREYLEFLSHATHATPPQRELMWREAETAPGFDGRLRKALLQTIPGSARFHAAKADSELRALLEEGAPPDIAAVARVRLDMLQNHAALRAENELLKGRLAKIADIERAADNPPVKKR